MATGAVVADSLLETLAPARGRSAALFTASRCRCARCSACSACRASAGCSSRRTWSILGAVHVPAASSSISTTRSPAASQLYPSQRPFTGLGQPRDAVRLRALSRSVELPQGSVLAAVFNTAWFAAAAGRPDGARSALVTALVLNRKIIGRGFWRGVFFYPVLLSPVVVALIWKWILQREGLLNALSPAPARRRDVWLNERRLGVLLERVRQHLGAHGLLHADPARRPAGDPRRPLRGRADGPRSPWRRVLADHAAAADAESAGRLVLALIRAVQIFDEIFVLTGGGPGSATIVHRSVHLPDRLLPNRSGSTASPPRRRWCWRRRCWC